VIVPLDTEIDDKDPLAEEPPITPPDDNEESDGSALERAGVVCG